VIGKAIALYALWRAWRGRRTWPPERSLLSLQDELNALRAQRRDALALMYDLGIERIIDNAGRTLVEHHRRSLTDTWMRDALTLGWPS
jgi:hypothetical protein